MTKFFIYSALISFAIFSSCTQDDSEINQVDLTTEEIDNNTIDTGVADFTIDNHNSEVYENSPLMITNNSVNAASYHWDFGNGDTSTKANPSYLYEIHGPYTVTLTITDRHGNKEELSHDINVLCLFAGNIHSDN